jgi:hypothetical protein
VTITPDDLNQHIKEYHAFKAEELLVMVDEHNEMVGSVERIVNLLEGEPVLDLQDHIIGRTGGMAMKQNEMSSTLTTIYERTNGGVSVTTVVKPDWTRNQKIGIAGLSITVAFAALPGFVGAIRFLAEWWVL